MVAQKYRWDFIGLSTDEKPTSETSEKVVNGSTYYCSDTSKLYVYCDGTWYERKPLGGGGGGGTSDFNDLSNRPKYNGSDMTGSTNIPEVKTYTAGSNVNISEQNVISATDTTYSNFVGTDGTAAGTAGLVPAPATTDAAKFLKADGTWEEVQAGGVTELTTADYNWPTNNPTSVALWLLEPGVYTWNNGVNVQLNTDNRAKKGISIVSSPENDKVSILNIPAKDGVMWFSTVTQSNGQQTRQFSIEGAVDYLTDTSGTAPLAANQGRVLKSQIGNLANLTTTDKTNLVAAINEAAAGGGSGGGVTELTSADYNYDYGSTGTNNCIALWLLSEGTYSWATTLRSSVRVTTTETAGDLSADGALVIAASNANLAKVYLYGDGSATTVTGRNILQMYRVNKTNGTSNVSGAAITTRELKQSTGNSESDVMSQNAVTSMVFADPSTKYKVQIGVTTSATGGSSVVVGRNSNAAGNGGVAVGGYCAAGADNSIALGRGASASSQGQFDISVNGTGVYSDSGYNNSNYRLISGVYDGQSVHDAATVAQGNTLSTSAPTTSTVGVLGQLYTDTTNMHTYQCTAISGDTYTWTQRW